MTSDYGVNSLHIRVFMSLGIAPVVFVLLHDSLLIKVGIRLKLRLIQSAPVSFRSLLNISGCGVHLGVSASSVLNVLLIPELLYA